MGKFIELFEGHTEYFHKCVEKKGLKIDESTLELVNKKNPDKDSFFRCRVYQQDDKGRRAKCWVEFHDFYTTNIDLNFFGFMKESLNDYSFNLWCSELAKKTPYEIARTYKPEVLGLSYEEFIIKYSTFGPEKK